jgi:hypothetical protein
VWEILILKDNVSNVTVTFNDLHRRETDKRPRKRADGSNGCPRQLGEISPAAHFPKEVVAFSVLLFGSWP